MASLSTLAGNIATAATWFWGIFEDFITMIGDNDLLLWPIILALVGGAVMLAIKVVRRFGLRGRR